MISKAAKVLEHELAYDEDGRIFFSQWREGITSLEKEFEFPTAGLLLTDELWADLGAPETITVTVEPGDKLNPG